jgi:hypothetical protein
MNDPQPKGNFAVSSAPVNRRTAKAAQRTETTAVRPPQVLTRIKVAQVKNRLGPPLSQFFAPGAALTPLLRATSQSLVVQTIGGTLGATAVFLGVIQSSLPLIGLGSTIFLTVIGWAWFKRRNALSRVAGTLPEWIAPGALEQLDLHLEQVAHHASPSTVEMLCRIKEALGRCAQRLNDTSTRMLASPDDALFIGETVRRYLPDTLQAYLQVPAADRESRVIDAGKTATVLLHAQLQTLMGQLQQRETRLSALAGEALLQQQRFLAAKTHQTP